MKTQENEVSKEELDIIAMAVIEGIADSVVKCIHVNLLDHKRVNDGCYRYVIETKQKIDETKIVGILLDN